VRKAIAVFNERGYDATSMEDLARELGVSKSAIYHHVPSKEHLLEQALDEGLGALSRLLEEARRRDEPAIARLRWTVEQSVHVLAAHLPAVTLVLRVRGNSPVEVEALRRRRAVDAELAFLVRDAVAEGSLRADLDPDLVSRLLFGMVNSLTEWLHPGHGSDPDVSGIARAISAVAFDGLERAARS